jgi:hypothetical protein
MMLEGQRDIIHNVGPVKNGILDIIYGVLFDPARTFAGIAHNPPVGAAVVIYISLHLLESLMGLFITPQYFREMHVPGMMGVDFVRHVVPLVAAGGFILGIMKWFVMAGLLHLVAELFSGKGSARGVFAVYGVAGLPVVFMIPVNVLLFYLAAGFTRTLIATLLGFGVFVWSTVLLIIGVREVHRFGTGRAVLTVFSPALALVTIMVLVMIIVGVAVSTLPVDPYIKIF